VREVTHPATVVHPAHGDLVALENQNGILWLLQTIEKSLFTGDSSLAADGESEQWDGLDSLIDPTSVIDLEGGVIQEADMEEATNTILEAHGFATDFFSNTKTMSDFVKTLYPRQRVEMPAPVNGRVGMSVSSFATQAGEIEANPNIFIRKAPTPPAAATSAYAPATPASIANGAVTGTSGDHNKGAATGTTNLNYLVTACNRFGESAPTAVQGGVLAFSQANKDLGVYAPLTITNPAVIGAYPPEFFKIYRSRATTAAGVPAASSSYSLIAQVPAGSQAAGGTVVYNDENLYLPFTSKAYVGEMSPSVLTFRQLLPMMKMDLAVMGPSMRWMILLYGTPIMFARKKWLRFINIGDLTVR
jgi:cell wall-associated NlpC family hydrolase